MPTEKKPFVDFRAIRSQITMEQALEHYGVLSTFKRSGHRLSGPCPIHNGNNPTQFRVDTEKNIWNCFSECKHGGNVLDFIAKKEDVSIHEAAIKACDWFGISLGEVKIDDSFRRASGESPQTRGKSGPKQKARTQSGQEPVRSDDNTPNAPLKFRLEHLHQEAPYLTETRGLTVQTISEFGMGFFKGEKGLMVGRIVIPIHNIKGELIAYAGRWPGDVPDQDTPKYKLPPGFKKSLELFNIHRAIKEPPEKPWVVVEGFFDAIKLHQHGFRKVVALMGSSMSPAQEKLIQQQVTASGHVILMLDEDEAGKAGREDIAVRLSKYCFVKIHVFGKPDTQPEHLSREELQRLLGGAQ
jgi:DNA primase